MHYFDHNATYPLIPAARAAWLDAVERFPGNPSSPHRLGQRADQALETARAQVAGWLGCSPFDLVWTAGATEAANTVIHHFAVAGEGEVWVSAIEHPCVLEAAKRLLPQRHRLIPVTADGVTDLDRLDQMLKQARPGLVAVMAANNETGVLQPWPEILALCQHHEVPFFCDAAQWIGRLPAQGLGRCDFVSGCAHKSGGPPGVGFLKCPSTLRPLLIGGPQEAGRRAGTENVPAVWAMTAALAEAERMLAAGATAERQLWQASFEQDLEAILPGAHIVGQRVKRLWNTTSVLMPPRVGDQRWVVKLDKLGFAVSTGSACASGQEKPSHVLTAIGHGAAEAGRMLRFSSGFETTAADWTALKSGILQVAVQLGAA